MTTVNPKMIELARESRGLSQTELATILEIPQSSLSRIEAGLLAASDQLLDAMAKKLDYLREFFLQDEKLHGAGTSALHYVYRRRQGIATRTLKRIEAEVNIMRIQIKKLLERARIKPSYVIPSFSVEDYKGDVSKIAQSVRAMWMLPRGPVTNLTSAVEDAGGIVIRHDFGTEAVDATSFRIPGMPPLFFLNERLPCDRWRYTLAHELAHLVLHIVPNPDMEVQADEFAAEFLMPKDDIKPLLHEFTLAKAATLKPYWKVSMWSLMRRARDLGIITDSQHRYMCMTMSSMGYRTREPRELDFPVEQPKTYRGLLELHMTKLGLSIPQLGKVLAMKPEVLKQRIYREKTGLRVVAGGA